MRRCFVGLAGLLFAAGCGDVTTNLTTDALIKDGAASGAARDSAVADATSATARQPAQCSGHACACDDGKDNDGDTLIDGFDPECSGPFDDDESSFATGAPAGSKPCRDCFWDNNAGSGDDDCRYPQECLQNPLAAGGKGACSSCDVSKKCVDSCAGRTPNGCDCFGCCEITSNGSRLLIALNDNCSLDKLKLDDPQACPRCVQNPTCRNACGRCELCLGRKPQDLPADCGVGTQEPGPRFVCDEGEPVCSDATGCAPGLYCQLGCCLYAVQ